MPVSIRQQRLARQAAATQAATTQEYEITDAAHRPDMRGEFAGAKVYTRGAKHYVQLTDAQARFYLDQGGIVPTAPAAPAEPA